MQNLSIAVGDAQLATEVHIEVAEPALEASDTATLNTTQFLSIFHFKNRTTELAYSRFHLDLWRNRVRFLAVGCQLMGLFYTLNARVNIDSQKDFRRAVEADFPEEAKYSLAFTMCIRYVVVTLFLVASYTWRFDPLRQWYATTVSFILLIICVGELGPTTLTLWRAGGERTHIGRFAINATDGSLLTELEQLTAAGNMAGVQMATFALFVFITSSTGISLVTYLLHAVLQLVFFEVLHQLCWTYFYLGQTIAVPNSLIHRVVLALYGVFVVMVHDTNTRRMFTAHLRLEAEKNRRIEQLSREKQRLNWELAMRDAPVSAPRSSPAAAAIEGGVLAALAVRPWPRKPSSSASPWSSGSGLHGSAKSSTSTEKSEPELAHFGALSLPRLNDGGARGGHACQPSQDQEVTPPTPPGSPGLKSLRDELAAARRMLPTHKATDPRETVPQGLNARIAALSASR